MATLVSGDTLSLNSLKSATGAGAASISSAMGSTPSAGSNISFSSFAIDTVGSISGYTYGVENTSEGYTLQFTGAGANFDSRIASRAANFTWSRLSGTTISATLSNSGKTATVSFLANGDNEAQTVRNSVAANGIRVSFSDGYNDHIGSGAGYGVNKDKTIYCVDSYDGNAVSLCLTADSPIIKADGSTINAEDLQEGDVLKGYSLDGLSPDDEDTFFNFTSENLSGNGVDVTVKNVTFSFAERYYNINNGEITATSEHPLYIKDSTDGLYKFKPVIGIEVGDKLIKGDTGTLTEVDITSIEAVDGTVEVVSIDVEDVDTYMVNGYVTHNKDEGNTFTDFDGPTAPTSVSYSHPSLSWSGGTADTNSTAGITAYDVQVDNNSDFSSPVISVTNWNNTSMQLAGGDIAAGTYYARVRNVQSGLKSGWTTTAAFSVVV